MRVDSSNLATFIQSLEQQQATSTIIHKMQEGHFDTLLFIYITWLSLNSHGRLNQDTIHKAISSCQEWHQGVISALAKLSQTLSLDRFQQDLPAESQKIFQLALHAELDMLTQSAPIASPKIRNDKQRISDSCANLTKYLKIRRLHLDHASRRELITLLTTCFGPAYRMLIEHNLNTALERAKVATCSTEQLTLADL